MPITTFPQAYVDRSFTPQILAQSGIPVIVPSSSTGGINATTGAITLDTALPQIYPNAWCYFPAGAVSGDATGGLYYCVFTSTTLGTVYAGKQGTTLGATTEFTPFIPATLTPATGSGASYTQTTGSEIALCNVTLPGGAMGPNGSLFVTHTTSCIPNVNSKLFRARLAGQAVSGLSFTVANGGGRFGAIIQNRGNQSLQVSNNSGGGYSPYSLGANASLVFTINTATSQSITLMHQIAVATDYSIMDGFILQVLYGQ